MPQAHVYNKGFQVESTCHVLFTIKIKHRGSKLKALLCPFHNQNLKAGFKLKALLCPFHNQNLIESRALSSLKAGWGALEPPGVVVVLRLLPPPPPPPPPPCRCSKLSISADLAFESPSPSSIASLFVLPGVPAVARRWCERDEMVR